MHIWLVSMRIVSIRILYDPVVRAGATTLSTGMGAGGRKLQSHASMLS